MSEQPKPCPETGSSHGVNLRDGRYRNRPGLEAPRESIAGALYAIYLRAFSPAGTLASVLPELDRLAALGVSTLWLLPVHPVGVRDRKGSLGSPYAVRDYRALDPAYGTEDDLRRLLHEAHARGLRVILDFVANHAAADHPVAADHPGWFATDSSGRLTRRVAEWSDVIDWRFEEPGVGDYLVGSALHWVRDCGLDGFRCDVAGMVPGEFWAGLREALLRVRPDHFLLAEWQDAALHETAFHASYDWVLYRALRDTGRGRTDARAVTDALETWNANFPRKATPLRFLENHDEPRVLSWLPAARLPAFAATTFLSGGLPLLYNGQEIGADHRPSLFEREPIAWDAGDPNLTVLYGDLLRRRRRAPWGPGRPRLVPRDRPEAVVAFTREAPGCRGLLVANLSPEPVRVRVRPARSSTGNESKGGTSPVFRDDAGHVVAPGTSLDLDPGEAWVGEAVDGTPTAP